MGATVWYYEAPWPEDGNHRKDPPGSRVVIFGGENDRASNGVLNNLLSICPTNDTTYVNSTGFWYGAKRNEFIRLQGDGDSVDWKGKY